MAAPKKPGKPSGKKTASTEEVGDLQEHLTAHVTALCACVRCPAMFKPVVSGGPVVSKIILVGQAPGVKEPVLGYPFAWTAGKSLFRWFQGCGASESEFRQRVYMAAVCRCYPGKNPKGGDRVPSPLEIANCAPWMEREFELLQPELVIPVGRLAIAQFLPVAPLAEIVGKTFTQTRAGARFDVLPLPHPSGASTWTHTEPGRTLLAQALDSLAQHPTWREHFPVS